MNSALCVLLLWWLMLRVSSRPSHATLSWRPLLAHEVLLLSHTVWIALVATLHLATRTTILLSSHLVLNRHRCLSIRLRSVLLLRVYWSLWSHTCVVHHWRLRVMSTRIIHSRCWCLRPGKVRILLLDRSVQLTSLIVIGLLIPVTLRATFGWRLRVRITLTCIISKLAHLTE